MQRNRIYVALAILALLLAREVGIVHVTAHSRTGSAKEVGWVHGAEGIHGSPSAVPRSGSLRVELSRGGERLDDLWIEGDGAEEDGELDGEWDGGDDEPRVWTAEVREERIGGLWWLPLWKPVTGSWDCAFSDEEGHGVGIVRCEAQFGFVGTISASYARELVREELREALHNDLWGALHVAREPTLDTAR